MAVRFNVKHGGSEKIEAVTKLSNQLYGQFFWHTELYINSKDLKDLKAVLKTIPRFSIDHLGLSKEGLTEFTNERKKAFVLKKLNLDGLISTQFP